MNAGQYVGTKDVSRMTPQEREASVAAFLEGMFAQIPVFLVDWADETLIPLRPPLPNETERIVTAYWRQWKSWRREALVWS